MGATKKRTHLKLRRNWGTVKSPVDGRDEDVTIADRIVAAIRSGNPLHVSAAAAGIARETLSRYLIEGRRIQIGLDSGISTKAYTETELYLADFAMRCAQAEAEFEIRAKQVMVNAGLGGGEITTVTVKTDQAGALIERTEKTEELRPDWRAMERVLVYRHPDRYGPRIEIGVHDPDDALSQDDLAAVALQSLEEAMARDGVVFDVDSQEVVDSGDDRADQA